MARQSGGGAPRSFRLCCFAQITSFLSGSIFLIFKCRATGCFPITKNLNVQADNGQGDASPSEALTRENSSPGLSGSSVRGHGPTGALPRAGPRGSYDQCRSSRTSNPEASSQTGGLGPGAKRPPSDQVGTEGHAVTGPLEESENVYIPAKQFGVKRDPNVN